MTKKLFVPEKVAASASSAGSSELPTAIKKGFDKIEDSKNSEDPSKLEGSALERLPQPVGYRLLVIPYYMPEKTKSGVYIPNQTRDRESFATVAAYVVKVGPDAYKDAARFPNGPSCKEGDFVIVRPNSGTRLKIHGREFRIINDDSVEAVVEDPRGIGRVA